MTTNWPCLYFWLFKRDLSNIAELWLYCWPIFLTPQPQKTQQQQNMKRTANQETNQNYNQSIRQNFSFVLGQRILYNNCDIRWLCNCLVFLLRFLCFAISCPWEHCVKLYTPHLVCMMIMMMMMIAFYIALFSALEQTHLHVTLHEWLAFYSSFCVCVCVLNIHRSGVLTALAWLVPHETAAILAQVLSTPYNHAPRHFMRSHIRKVYAYLAVTCHLHFWQNDWDLLRATAVTRGWNRYWNKSQHSKLTLEKKILLPLLQGFKPATFQSRVRHSNGWAIPLPLYQHHCVIYILSHQGRSVAKWIGHLGCHPFQPHSHWRD